MAADAIVVDCYVIFIHGGIAEIPFHIEIAIIQIAIVWFK